MQLVSSPPPPCPVHKEEEAWSLSLSEITGMSWGWLCRRQRDQDFQQIGIYLHLGGRARSRLLLPPTRAFVGGLRLLSPHGSIHALLREELGQCMMRLLVGLF